VPFLDGLVGDVLRHHRLAQALRGDEDDVPLVGQEVEVDDALDGVSVDARGLVPLEVGHGLEAAEALHAALDAALARSSSL